MQRIDMKEDALTTNEELYRSCVVSTVVGDVVPGCDEYPLGFEEIKTSCRIDRYHVSCRSIQKVCVYTK